MPEKSRYHPPVPEKLPFADVGDDPYFGDPEDTFRVHAARSVNDMFDRMVKGLSPSRRIRGRGPQEEHPEDQWHPIDHVHLTPGAPKTAP